VNAALAKHHETLDLRFPWGTNAQGQVIMSPVDFGYASRAAKRDRLPAGIGLAGKAGRQLGIAAADGVKAPDLAPASAAHDARHRDQAGYAAAARGNCIEVISPANPRPQMQHKMRPSFAVGALEARVLNTEGRPSFFAAGNAALALRRPVPEAPLSL
jgi:hypothetical protein